MRRVSHRHKTIGGQRIQQLCIASIEKYQKEEKNEMHKRTTFFICWCWLDRDPGVRGRRRRLCCLESSRQLQNKQQRGKKNSFFPPWKKSSGFRQLWRVHSEAAGRAKATKKGGGGKRNKTTTHIRITCRWRKTIHDSHDSLSHCATKQTKKKQPPKFVLSYLSISICSCYVGVC